MLGAVIVPFTCSKYAVESRLFAFIVQCKVVILQFVSSFNAVFVFSVAKAHFMAKFFENMDRTDGGDTAMKPTQRLPPYS